MGYSCQVVLLFLSLRCSISVRFAFRSATQERVSSLKTSASLLLTEKWRKAIVKVYTTFALLSQWFIFPVSCFRYALSHSSVIVADHSPLQLTDMFSIMLPSACFSQHTELSDSTHWSLLIWLTCWSTQKLFYDSLTTAKHFVHIRKLNPGFLWASPILLLIP